eukprot:3968427-Pyramimonas_sp.AAC.1
MPHGIFFGSSSCVRWVPGASVGSRGDPLGRPLLTDFGRAAEAQQGLHGTPRRHRGPSAVAFG